MKKLFASFVIGLSLAAFAQDTPDIILVTNQVTMAMLPQASPPPAAVPVPLQLVTQQVVNVYRKVATQSPVMLSPENGWVTTNIIHIKGVRQWKKQCPFCKNDCVSTNASSWIVNSQDGEPEARFTTVTFTCTHTDCGEHFGQTIQLKLPKTAIEELPPVP